jgi:hypothetical protein
MGGPHIKNKKVEKGKEKEDRKWDGGYPV